MSKKSSVKSSFNDYIISHDTYKKSKNSLDDTCYKDLVDEDGNQLDYNCVKVTKNAKHIKEELV